MWICKRCINWGFVKEGKFERCKMVRIKAEERRCFEDVSGVCVGDSKLSKRGIEARDQDFFVDGKCGEVGDRGCNRGRGETSTRRWERSRV